jgi:hypothetical protein
MGQAHVAQLVEHILGKDGVHRFDPGRGLHIDSHEAGSVISPGVLLAPLDFSDTKEGRDVEEEV